MTREARQFLVSFVHDGEVCSQPVIATSEEDLRSRLHKLPDAKIDGVLWDPPKGNGHDWSSDDRPC